MNETGTTGTTETPPQPPNAGPPPSPPQWTKALTSTAPQPGPAGFFYADLPNRIIAYIIDIIILAVAGIVVGIVLGTIGLNIVTIDLNSAGVVSYNYIAALVYGVIGLAISAGYFIYTWTSMRATIGMRVLGMQIGNAADGATLTMDQAIRRWLAVGGWVSIVQFLNPLPLIGVVIGLLAFLYVIYLLYTTASSPTKQGFHDVFAHTMVVKAARAVA
jgi:uncharacterized RDD family membrane protein YckC